MAGQVYPDSWHVAFGDQTLESARRILPSLIELFGARSVIEVGCGHAHWSKVALDCGVEEIHAIDGAWNSRAGLLVDSSSYQEADLSRPIDLPHKFDLAICLEVAEHVAPESSEILVNSLVQAADVVLFGAAIPLQGGHGHINEQWPGYWRDRFAIHGFAPFDLIRPRHWSDRNIHYWYRQNCFVFVRQSAEMAIERAKGAAAEMPPFPMDAVHPEKFEETATYRTIVMKRLLRRLPGWTKARFFGKD